MDTTNIESLMERLQEIKGEQKSLNEQEAIIKEHICALLDKEGLEKYESEHCTVRLQARNKKDYGPTFRAKETELKELKKLQDDLGDYEIVSTETSLVYAAPKTPAVPSF
jgi:hypothetical protein